MNGIAMVEATSPPTRYRMVPGAANEFPWHVIDTADHDRPVAFYRTKAKAEARVATWNQRGSPFVVGVKDAATPATSSSNGHGANETR
jgi:hypothetical protein